MVGILFIVCIITLLVCVIISIKDIDFDDNLWFIMLVVGILGSVIFGFWTFYLIYEIGHEDGVYWEIYRVENENKEIHSSILSLLTRYTDYDVSTYDELKDVDTETLVHMFSTLENDQFVQEKIAKYKENEEKLKTLKEKLYNEIPHYKWLLYFGH